MTQKNVTMTGLKSGEEIEKIYNEIAIKRGVKEIKDVPMPLVITAVDVYSCKEYVFTSKKPEGKYNQNQYITDASIGTAVRASSSFPIVFSPCLYKEFAFLDGGILDNMPVNEVKKQGADMVLGINFESDVVNKTSNIMDLGMRIIDIMGTKISEGNIDLADDIVTIPSDGTGLLDADKIDFCYKSGYKTIMENKDRIIAKFAKM